MQGPPISNIYYYEQQAVYLSRPSAGLHRQWSFLPRTLPLALCHIFILAKVIEMDFFKYAEGKLILTFILLFIILCAGAWGSYLLWMNRKNKLKEAIQEENEFIAIPVVSHLTQTMGEWLGLYIGVIHCVR